MNLLYCTLYLTNVFIYFHFMSSDVAAAVQTRALCALLVLHERRGTKGIWSEPREPTRLHLQVCFITLRF